MTTFYVLALTSSIFHVFRSSFFYLISVSQGCLSHCFPPIILFLFLFLDDKDPWHSPRALFNNLSQTIKRIRLSEISMCGDPFQSKFFTASHYFSFWRNILFASLSNPPSLQPFYLKPWIKCVSSPLCCPFSTACIQPTLSQPTSAAYTLQSCLWTCCSSCHRSSRNRRGRAAFQKLTIQTPALSVNGFHHTKNQEESEKYCLGYSTTANHPIILHNVSAPPLNPWPTRIPPVLLNVLRSFFSTQWAVAPMNRRSTLLLWEVNMKELSSTLIAPCGGAFVASHWLPKVSFGCMVSWCCHTMYLPFTGQYQQ